MKIAVEGCCHGELDSIYAEIAKREQSGGYKVDMLLICGDFQAVRNPGDLAFMAVPDKYKKIGGFYRYYTGEKKAPMLTIVIGGNHEASNYMWELYHGGWLAPNLYYLGSAGSVLVNGLRLAGISGIYQPEHYTMGHFERFPYNKSHLRSIYHTRIYDVNRLMLLDSPDILLSHDWPLSIEQHGETAGLIRHKPFFQSEIRTNSLGSPPLLDLLKTIRPARWFSAHLHTRFEATFTHETPTQSPDVAEIPEATVNPEEIIIEDEEDETEAIVDGSGKVVKGGTDAPTAAANPDEISMDDDDELKAEVEQAPGAPSRSISEHTSVDASTALESPSRQSTYFLALDKCLPNRRYLEIVDVPSPMPVGIDGVAITFDPQWLAITRAFFPYLSLEARQKDMPDLPTMKAEVGRQLAWVKSHLTHGGAIPINDVQQFKKTASGGTEQTRGVRWYTNPQTEALCKLLEVENVINPPPSTLTTSSIPVPSIASE
ncbi:Metallophos-domain-containing protein [Calocera viscosa TUFC12733]|uniref:Metallophos-domain-containing protein n=1 Tax=Calocera viscosa (strain TUFC12733) TaxID=1330018 RepID=A0A167FQQ4_CALVF|nr:Metallophos-domain-containing protein [Calocera viscosa TUFC12733]